VDSIFQVKWNKDITYGDVFLENEKQFSKYNFEVANVEMLLDNVNKFHKEAQALVEKKLPIPAYDYVLKMSHSFNLLDARRAISIAERPTYIKKIRDTAKLCAECYMAMTTEAGK